MLGSTDLFVKCVCVCGGGHLSNTLVTQTEQKLCDRSQVYSIFATCVSKLSGIKIENPHTPAGTQC